ncbi:MAG TPA: nitroreductase family protein [Saprospiraceae bacterium]|nr:nitroreductase family protein [Saprospiraceae bacterium]
MKSQVFIDYYPARYPVETMLDRAKSFYGFMNSRRTVRDFAPNEIPDDLIRDILLAAGTAPSGANKQPWTFCVVRNPEIKREIRIAAEKEEYDNYHGRMPEEWLKDLEPLGTNWEKPFLEIAPALIVVFRKNYDILENGSSSKNYYVHESVGLACGILIAAIHNAGLVALTHTPSPMNFLQTLLKRPQNEKPFLLIPIGFPEPNARVPDIHRKKLDEIAIFY